MSHLSHSATDITDFIPDAPTVLEVSKPKLKNLFERIETALDRYFGEDEATMLNCLRGLR
jgi:hypothetical protein